MKVKNLTKELTEDQMQFYLEKMKKNFYLKNSMKLENHSRKRRQKRL